MRGAHDGRDGRGGPRARTLAGYSVFETDRASLEVALPRCAAALWSGLKFVRRVADRTPKGVR